MAYVKLVVSWLLAVMLAGCVSFGMGSDGERKLQVGMPKFGGDNTSQPKPAEKPVAVTAQKLVPAVPKTIIVKEKKCTSRNVPEQTGVREVPVFSTGCGNLLPDPKFAKKGGGTIAGGFPFARCSFETKEEFLKSFDGPEKCRPRVSKEFYGVLLERQGFPLAPNAAGFEAFLKSSETKIVACSKELLAKVKVARVSADGQTADFNHARDTCYQYGSKVEKVLVFEAPVMGVKKEKECTEVEVEKPNPDYVEPPPMKGAATPAGCTALILHAHLWDGKSLPDALRREVEGITPKESGFTGASVSRVLGQRFRSGYTAGVIKYAPAGATIVMRSRQAGAWKDFGSFPWEGKEIQIKVPLEYFSAQMEAIFRGGAFASPPTKDSVTRMQMTVGELRPPDIAKGECHRNFHAVTAFVGGS